MSYQTLELEVQGGVAHLALNRPDNGNAIDLQLSKDLMYAALQCDEDASVRAILIKGRGRMFCAGGDLASFGDAGDDLPRLLKEMTTYVLQSTLRAKVATFLIRFCDLKCTRLTAEREHHRLIRRLKRNAIT